MARSAIIEDMPPAAVGKAAAKPLDPVAAEDDFRFHALLYPNRSLSPDGFKRVLGVVILANLINAVVYVTLGAWPVAFFCGADIVIVWLAFQASYVSGRRHERIMLTEDALWVSRVLPSGHETRWRLDPWRARVRIDRPVRHETQLHLCQHGRTLIVGSFLSPKERGELAEALDRALLEARA
ncbi:DUF2244 domain-containing protein [Parvularcula dongshanensis]|uniref:Putative membrane protein n=1 Tax=Parvularcula dongshanensis TaxID=1173995 RepID=A0A840HZH9_9PROT|nr:DUF2244 domain-containing protein [Parvularcula dongshanensis]MBB4657979.1 putative membrane protein [Parvularcula dongshanensis]